MGGLIARQRRGEIALRHLHVADLVVRTDRSRCQPALPGSALARRSTDIMRGLIARQRGGEIALRHLHVADLVYATPTGRAASRRCRDRPWPGAPDIMGGLVACQRRGQIALRHLHVADLVVRDRQVALPAGVAGIAPGQALAISRDAW